MKRPKLSNQERRTDLVRAIEIAWSSLETHLESSIKSPRKKKVREHAGNEKFNAACVREYAEIISICAVELEHLTHE